MAQQNARASSGNDSAAGEAWGPINYPQASADLHQLHTVDNAYAGGAAISRCVGGGVL
jgi:hypothetical protein